MSGDKTRPRNSQLKQYSQNLRKAMTKEERKLWYQFLKNFPKQFYRQRVFDRYIVDFYCPSLMIVIELDGSQHYEDEGIEADKIRDGYFEKLGITVLRFTNLQINREFESVKQTIYSYLN